MRFTRIIRYVELGTLFLAGTAITLGGLTLSTLSVVGIGTLIKTPACLD